MNTPHDLNERLSHEADGFFRRGGTELEISQVLDRAGEIRRGRRMRGALLVAACVLAVAVPVGVATLDRDRPRSEPSPAQQQRVDRSALSLTGLDPGVGPRTGYAQDGVLHLAGSSYASKGGRLVGFTAFRGGVLVATSDDQGTLQARRLDSARSWPMSGSFVTSADGAVAAFLRPDGTPVVVRQDGELTLPRIGAGDGSRAVAVSEACGHPGTDGCEVWANAAGARPSIWISPADGTARRVDTDLRSLAALDAGHMAGTVSVTDTGSCSAVETLEGTTLWRTCEHSLVSFAPDGRRLLAAAAYRDGAGDRQVTILDAGSGKVVLDLATAGEAFVQQVVWEDSSHLLATLSDGGRWAVVRIGLDGHREYAVGPVAGADPYESPFVLPSR